MTRDELLVKLKSLEKGDPEINHCEADEAILEFLGDAEIIEAFQAIEKWYA